MTVNLRRGGVYLVGFPNIDFRTWKPRPTLLVQDPNVRGPYPDLLVAAITSSIETAGPTRILIQMNTVEGRAMGLRTDSVIALDNLATVPENRLMRQLGTCPIMPAVDRILKRLFSLS